MPVCNVYNETVYRGIYSHVNLYVSKLRMDWIGNTPSNQSAGSRQNIEENGTKNNG
jgi:hypothetical protein